MKYICIKLQAEPEPIRLPYPPVEFILSLEDSERSGGAMTHTVRISQELIAGLSALELLAMLSETAMLGSGISLKVQT